MAWMETDYSKHVCFRWKVKCHLEHLGAQGTMGNIMSELWIENRSERDLLLKLLHNCEDLFHFY